MKRSGERTCGVEVSLAAGVAHAIATVARATRPSPRARGTSTLLPPPKKTVRTRLPWAYPSVSATTVKVQAPLVRGRRRGRAIHRQPQARGASTGSLDAKTPAQRRGYKVLGPVSGIRWHAIDRFDRRDRPQRRGEFSCGKKYGRARPARSSTHNSSTEVISRSISVAQVRNQFGVEKCASLPPTAVKPSFS